MSCWSERVSIGMRPVRQMQLTELRAGAQGCRHLTASYRLDLAVWENPNRFGRSYLYALKGSGLAMVDYQSFSSASPF